LVRKKEKGLLEKLAGGCKIILIFIPPFLIFRGGGGVKAPGA